jgi:AraC-like DNA-binding protein
VDGSGEGGVVRQRASAVAELPALLGEIGVDPARVFEGTGVDPATFAPDSRLSFDALHALLDRAAGATGMPDIGLRLGLRFRMAHHGVIGALRESAPTLGAALEAFVRWQPGYSSGAVVFLQTEDGMTAFGSAISSAASRPRRPYLDIVVGIGLRMVTLLSGGAVRPVEVHMAVRPPGDRGPYERGAGAPVRFDQPLTCLYLPSEALDLPVPGRDAARHARLAAEVAAAVNAPALETRVRGALRTLILGRKPTMEAVAGELGLHPRTLRRRLGEDGIAFDALRDEVRLAAALELLELTDLPVGEIAASLSYASPEVFAESFRRMRGLSPRGWRAAHARRG